VFGSDEDDAQEADMAQGEKIVSMDELMRVLEGWEE